MHSALYHISFLFHLLTYFFVSLRLSPLFRTHSQSELTFSSSVLLGTAI